jgi:hypothetical protein
MASVKINYYTKYGCHLCDEGLSILRNFPKLEITIIDIEENEEKFKPYLLRIPVISSEDGNTELGWPFTHEDVAEVFFSN